MPDDLLCIDAAGDRRVLANLPEQFPDAACCALYGDSPEETLIPREGWRDLITAMGDPFDWPFHSPVRDQNGIGQCNCEAATAVLESVRAIQGLPEIEFSPADLYHRINGGRDQGSTLQDALRVMRDAGVGTAAESGRLWKRETFRPASAESRRRYRFDEFKLCPTADHVMSAALRGRVLALGIPWHQNFQTDSEGWLVNPSGPAGGHAYMACKPAFRERNGGIEFGIASKNSWSERWGRRGFFITPLSSIKPPRPGFAGWGCYAISSVTDEGGVVPVPR